VSITAFINFVETVKFTSIAGSPRGAPLIINFCIHSLYVVTMRGIRQLILLGLCALVRSDEMDGFDDSFDDVAEIQFDSGGTLQVGPSLLVQFCTS